jgi:hypothetical protein
MGITERILDGLRATVQLNERVTSMARRVEGLAREVRDLDRRMIRVETALELASSGRFTPLPPDEDDR